MIVLFDFKLCKKNIFKTNKFQNNECILTPEEV